MPATSTISPTGNQYIDGVLSGSKWAVSSFTYSFPTSGAYYGSAYGSGEPTTGFEALNSAQQAAVRTILTSYSAVANVTFSEIAETASQHSDFRFAESDKPATAWAYYPTTRAEGGDVWLNNSQNYYDNPIRGNYAYATLLHEVGHAMGLKHAHEASGSFNAMPADRDSMEYTVMSYRSYVGGSASTGYVNETWGYAQSLMVYDIAALQKMYGANFSTNSGNSTYSWSSSTGAMSVNGVSQGAPGGNKIFLTVWDGGGTDTYDFSNYSTNLKVDLQPGAWTITSAAQLAKLHYDGTRIAAGNIATALLYNNDLRSLIENANGGSGNDFLTGNVANNVLNGNLGDDRLLGGGGSDTLNGGLLGNDTAVFSGARSQYKVTLLADTSLRITDNRAGAPDGADLLIGIESVQFSDRTYSYAELVTGLTVDVGVSVDVARTINGDAGNNTIEGGGANDKLYGHGGDDVLIGKGGNDLLDGGAGNDILDGGTGADQLIGGTGTDTARYTSATTGVIVSLASPSGNTGEAKGDTFNSIENLTGSAFADTLTGNSSANVLEGGAGADRLDGGSGTDTASYTSAASGVTADLTSAGNNKGDAAGDIYSSIENLTGSAFADRLVGNSSINVLTGGAADDVLDGRSSNDSLFGGDGDDFLLGGAGADTLDGGAGFDTASYSTATALVVADLTTTSGSRGDATSDRFVSIENLTGSNFNDTLRGNSGANTIDGGAGADSLYGREGDDVLIGGAGNDFLDGGSGNDVGLFSGASTDFTWSQNSDGSWTIRDLRTGSPQGTDRFIGIETLRFTDVAQALGPEESGPTASLELSEPENAPGQHDVDTFVFKSFGQSFAASSTVLEMLDDPSLVSRGKHGFQSAHGADHLGSLFPMSHSQENHQHHVDEWLL
jgi:serralysin